MPTASESTAARYWPDSRLPLHVALELVKPLAIAQAFSAFCSYQFARGSTLLILGTLAIAYSLTAELALVSASRGDLQAQRASEAFQGQAARDRYDRAKTELATLKPTRAIQELEILVAKTAGPCGAENGTGRWVCRPSPHAQELGRAKRRAELEATLSNTGQTTVQVADPGSAALATYLSAIGLEVSVDRVAQWLALIPVLALEAGSSLAMVLVSSLSRRKLPRCGETGPRVT